MKQDVLHSPLIIVDMHRLTAWPNNCVIVQEWGVTLAQMHAPTATTTAYTEMLLDVALRQVRCKYAPICYAVQTPT